jgi:hypothetical protein
MRWAVSDWARALWAPEAPPLGPRPRAEQKRSAVARGALPAGTSGSPRRPGPRRMSPDHGHPPHTYRRAQDTTLTDRRTPPACLPRSLSRVGSASVGGVGSEPSTGSAHFRPRPRPRRRHGVLVPQLQQRTAGLCKTLSLACMEAVVFHL